MLIATQSCFRCHEFRCWSHQPKIPQTQTPTCGKIKSCSETFWPVQQKEERKYMWKYELSYFHNPCFFLSKSRDTSHFIQESLLCTCGIHPWEVLSLLLLLVGGGEGGAKLVIWGRGSKRLSLPWVVKICQSQICQICHFDRVHPAGSLPLKWKSKKLIENFNDDSFNLVRTFLNPCHGGVSFRITLNSSATFFEHRLIRGQLNYGLCELQKHFLFNLYRIDDTILRKGLHCSTWYWQLQR